MMQRQQHQQCESNNNLTEMIDHIISANLIAYLPIDLNKNLYSIILCIRLLEKDYTFYLVFLKYNFIFSFFYKFFLLQ